MCKCVLKRSTREMRKREREPAGSLDLLVRNTRMHKGSSRSSVDRTREYIYYWCISGTKEEAKERVLYSNKKKKKRKRGNAKLYFLSSRCLAIVRLCHRGDIILLYYYIYMMFIATINIILVRFINYTSLLCYIHTAIVTFIVVPHTHTHTHSDDIYTYIL